MGTIAKERPIIFSAPMVRAILAGSKTQTRRVVRQVTPQHHSPVQFFDPHEILFEGDPKVMVAVPCRIGQRLWVRETFLVADDPPGMVHRRADEHPMADVWRHEKVRWTSPLYMRRNQSRIVLEVTALRCERLHDITEEDASAEGMVELHYLDAVKVCRAAKELGCGMEDAKAFYRVAWDELNGKKHPWATNPWVWVITFRRL